MNIRERIFFGVGTYVFLATIISFFAYRELLTISTRLNLVEIADDITHNLGEVRRYEKNFLLYGEQDDLDEFQQYLSTLKVSIDDIKTEIVKAMGPGNYEMIKKQIMEYEDLFAEVAENVGLQNGKDTAEKMRSKAREIETLLKNLREKERAEISATLKRAMGMLIFALLTIMIVGAFVNRKLAKSIAEPIKSLEKLTQKIAMGDFSETLEVKGKDEIASLEISFNMMEEKLKHALKSLEDTIQQLRDKQSQLVEAEKLASIGILASGIAHEISNPLTSVLTFSNLMLEKTPENDPNHERLKMMARETSRARDIVRQLLSFAKEETIKPIKVNVNCPVIEIIESFIAQEAFRDIELTMKLSKDLPDIYIDPARIGQVVSNILLNAVSAITPPGKIEVATQRNNNFVEVVFHDTGHGIPGEDIGKVFDPFFTTKEKTRGSGLGLAVSYGIIKKHGGDIEVRSELGKGSTFIMRLPISG
jgi:two-component system, NtrC family, sensor kinase